MIPLSELATAFQEMELQVLIQPATATAPEQLFVAFQLPGREEPVYLQLLYLPGVSDPWLLQYYVQLPVTLPDDLAPLGRFVNLLDPHLPVPGFELSEARRLLYYRYVRVCAQPDPTGVIETALVIAYLVGRFAPIIDRAVAGEPFELLVSALAHEAAAES